MHPTPPSIAFILSPAHCNGKRADRLLADPPASDLARRLRADRGVAVGDLFASLSTLYFRGKLAYAQRFADPPFGCPPISIIVPGIGLAEPEARLNATDLACIRRIPVDPRHTAYRIALTRGAQALADHLGAAGRAVFLGSVATNKYLGPLSEVFGARLFVPAAFAGRGSMSRGSLLLHQVQLGEPLSYVPGQLGGAPAPVPAEERRERPR